jgi:hypothetical protein
MSLREEQQRHRAVAPHQVGVGVGALVPELGVVCGRIGRV